MRDTVQERILGALMIALRPIVRALLRGGIGYGQFAEICKSAYVDISSEDYGLRGRPTNISRVAVMTGLPKKEVRRLRDKSVGSDDETTIAPSPMASVLHRWYSHKDFLTESGEPKELHFDSGKFAFSDLVRACCAEIPPGAMRAELSRINAVVESTDGRLRVVEKTVSGSETHAPLISGLNDLVYPAALALLEKTGDDDSDTWINKVVRTKRVRQGDLSRLRRLSSERLRECMQSITDLYDAYETLYAGEEHESDQVAIGVGVFCFEANESKGC